MIAGWNRKEKWHRWRDYMGGRRKGRGEDVDERKKGKMLERKYTGGGEAAEKRRI